LDEKYTDVEFAVTTQLEESQGDQLEKKKLRAYEMYANEREKNERETFNNIVTAFDRLQLAAVCAGSSLP
jgi:hypothetical protein